MSSFGDIRSLLNSERGAEGYVEYAPLVTALLNYEDPQTPLNVAIDYVREGNHGYVPGCLFRVHGHHRWQGSMARCLGEIFIASPGKRDHGEIFIDAKFGGVNLFRVSTHSVEFSKAMRLAQIHAISKYRGDMVATFKDEIEGGDDEKVNAFLDECINLLVASVKYWGGRTAENAAKLREAAMLADPWAASSATALKDLERAVCARQHQVITSWLGVVEAVHYAEPFSGSVAEEISRSLERELFKILR